MSEYRFELMTAVLGYSNHRVLMLFSWHHKQINIDPWTTPKPKPKPKIGRTALHRLPEHHRDARL